jgi:hypothetical protein
MTSIWKSVLKLTPSQVSLLVRQSPTTDVLKARLPRGCQHPRALLTLLEGLALWSGRPLHVVLSAAPSFNCSDAAGLFGDDLFPGESQLVRWELAARGRRELLRGLGDFRALRAQSPTGLWP